MSASAVAHNNENVMTSPSLNPSESSKTFETGRIHGTLMFLQLTAYVSIPQAARQLHKTSFVGILILSIIYEIMTRKTRIFPLF